MLRVRAPLVIGALRAPPRLVGNTAFLGWGKVHARLPRLGESDGDRLLGRSRSMLAFTNVVELLANELAGLGARCFALALGLARPLDGLLLWHGNPPMRGLLHSCILASTLHRPCLAAVEARWRIQRLGE